ncbi:MAG: transglutaminase family protein [Ktedonobacteraceae bacterium]|nr:transglutaminase family protein [Chloroflexota bacterium]
MHLNCESSLLEAYLCEDDIVDYSHPLVQETSRQLHTASDSEIERVSRTFEFVRDSIHHSWDIQSPQVTCKASEVLSYGEGLCYAKAHLLAALLRSQGIPTGFCYQRLTAGETAETGYTLHGLNAVYLASEARWIRLDARGNKPGIQAEFSTGKEQLAYVVRPELDEIDYPTMYAQPHPKVVKALREQTNCLHLCQYFLPDHL